MDAWPMIRREKAWTASFATELRNLLTLKILAGALETKPAWAAAAFPAQLQKLLNEMHLRNGKGI